MLPHHYHGYSGLPCDCPWGGKTHRRPIRRLAGEYFNRVRNQAKQDKKLKAPEGKQVLNALSKLPEEYDRLTPFLAQRWKKGDVHYLPEHPSLRQYGNQPQRPAGLYLKNIYAHNPETPPSEIPHEDWPRKFNPLENELPNWMQWYNARQHPTRQGVNVLDPSFDVGAIRDATRRHQEDLQEKARRERLIGELDIDAPVDHRLPNGWTVNQLVTPEALSNEGEAMGHCIGSSEQPYSRLLENNQIAAFSLRDPKGWPHGTWHLNSDGSVAEVFGNADRGLSDDQRMMYEDWAQTKEVNPTAVGNMEDDPDDEEEEIHEPWWQDEYYAEGTNDPHDYLAYDKYDHAPDEYDRAHYDADEWGMEGPYLSQEPHDFEGILEGTLDGPRPGTSTWMRGERLEVPRDQPQKFNPVFADKVIQKAENEGDEEGLEMALDDKTGEVASEINSNPEYEEMEPWDRYNAQYRELQAHPQWPGIQHMGDKIWGNYNPEWRNDLIDRPSMNPNQQQLVTPNGYVDNQWQDYNDATAMGGRPNTVGKTAVRTKNPHPHIKTGDPCYCPWGNRHGQEFYGRIHEANKIDWLIDRKDKYSQTPEGQQILKYLKGLVTNSPKLDPLTPWLYREVKKNRLELAGEGLRAPNSTDFALPLEHWADWFDSNSSTRRGVDIMQMTADDMKDKIADWDEELQAKMEEERQMAQGEIMHRFPDDWTIRRLKPDELHDEGDAMGHCVGGYGNEVRNGTCGIFSLRDPDNQPHVTTEMRPAEGGAEEGWDAPEDDEDSNYQKVRPHGAQVWQIQGKSDTEPVQEYKDRLKDWFGTLDPKPFVPSNTEKTHVPIATDPDSLTYWYEPEEDYGGYGGDDPYRLSPDAADDYGLPTDDDGERFEYEGDPDWDKIVHSTLNDSYSGRGPTYGPKQAENVAEIAHETNRWDDLQAAVDAEYPSWEDEFYSSVYNPDRVDHPHEQWSDWDRGQVLNALRGSQNRSALQRGPDEQPIAPERPIPQIHPEQGGLPLPGQIPQPHPEYDLTGPYGFDAYTPNAPYRDQRHPWYAPLSKVAAKVPPIYYRFVFSPQNGVSLVDNDTAHPAWTPYHRDIATSSGEANLIHGYAYRIGDGWRLTDQEHKPISDPFVIAQVVRALLEKEGHQMPRAASEWTPTSWDFSRTHYGLPSISQD